MTASRLAKSAQWGSSSLVLLLLGTALAGAQTNVLLNPSWDPLVAGGGNGGRDWAFTGTPSSPEGAYQLNDTFGAGQIPVTDASRGFLKVEVNGLLAMDFQYAASEWHPANAGTKWTASVYARPEWNDLHGSQAALVKIEFADAAQNLLTNSASTVATNGSPDTYQLGTVSLTAPAGAAYVRMEAGLYNPVAAGVHGHVLFDTAGLVPAWTQFTSVGASTISGPWLGFGYNQYPQDRNSGGYDLAWTPGDWNLTTNRMAALRPGLVRINLYREWFNAQTDANGELVVDAGGHPIPLPVGTYSWDNIRMNNLYAVLQWYQDHQIPVMGGLWHSGFQGNDDPAFYTSSGPGSFAQLLSDLYAHLYYTKDFTNLVWFTPSNEPLGSALTFSQWTAAIQNTWTAFNQAALPAGVLVGPDSWSDWTGWAAQWDSNYLSGYDHHYYLNSGQGELSSESVEFNLQLSQVNAVHSHDPSAKPVFLSEMAAVSANDVDYWFNANPLPTPSLQDYQYALGMMDYGIQAARAGDAGALAWALDGFDYGKSPGMWDISGNHGGTTLRPWSYTWSLLCRFFPARSVIYLMSQPANMRILGASIENGDRAWWSFALVNRDSDSHTVTLSVPGWSGGVFDAYVFTPTNAGDGVSLSLPASVVACSNLNAGLSLTVPANAAAVVTSLDRMPQSPPALTCQVLTGPTQLALSWPGWATNYSLLSATSLAPSVFWSAVPGTAALSNGVLNLALLATNRAQFFRLVLRP